MENTYLWGELSLFGVLLFWDSYNMSEICSWKKTGTASWSSWIRYHNHLWERDRMKGVSKIGLLLKGITGNKSCKYRSSMFSVPTSLPLLPHHSSQQWWDPNRLWFGAIWLLLAVILLLHNRHSSSFTLRAYSECLLFIKPLNKIYWLFRSQDESPLARESTILVLSHLMSNDMIQTRGVLSEPARCISDSVRSVREAAESFFRELNQRSDTIIQLLPEFLYRLSSKTERLPMKAYKIVFE